MSFVAAIEPRGIEGPVFRICDNEGRMHSASSRLLPRAACAGLLGSVFLLGGCGYHTADTAVHLPKTVHLIDIPVFRNHTQAYQTEVSFTQAVIRELTSRTAYRVTSAESDPDADALLRGDIVSFTVYPLTYDATTNQSSSFLVTVTARVVLTDKRGRVLYQNNGYVFRQQYETTQDLVSFIQEDHAAVERLSRDFAQNLVADILESF